MRLPLTAALLAGGLLAALPVAADDVLLTNGKTFEDVVAEVEGDRVLIHLPGGVLTLPASRVEAIARGESSLERYRQRKRALVRGGVVDARAWLALAEEARRDGFEHGFRDAALAAARRQPDLPEVAPVMRELDYAFDEALGEWVPREEALRRRGLVRLGDRWVSAEERDSLLAAAAAREREHAERARLDRITATVEALAELELARGLARPEPSPAPPAYYPVYSVPFYLFPVHRHHPPTPAPSPAPEPPPAAPRPPAPAQHHHGGFDSSFGGGLGPPELIPGSLSPDAAPPPGRIVSGRR